MAGIEELLNSIKRPNGSHDLKYLLLDLANGNYDVAILAKQAKMQGVAQRLGYLAEATASALERTQLGDSTQLYGLAKRLQSSVDNWTYLDPCAPDFAKRIFQKDRSDARANTWKMYGYFTDAEIDDWLKLHAVPNDRPV